ncbi:hypothetical protein LSM04_004456 [Trypanosoma melophagium]|uniref:uncharacterized protein n=1 Tax=Trypanosoma melophagium TaxID=715481 RepID=UPI00351A4A4F|nr:hypothetical protein LSM04_004456 [Trypanosoma melophagium]
MIDELRGMNIKLQKEKGTLIAFRQQSLNYDFHVMNTLENDGGIDEEVLRAFAQHEGRQTSYGMSLNYSLGTMSPQIRSFERCLSSRIIEEQKRSSSRCIVSLRPQTTSLTRSSVFGRVEGGQTSCKNEMSIDIPDSINKNQQFSIDNYRSPSRIITSNLVNTAPEENVDVSLNPVTVSVSTSATLRGINKDEMAEQATMATSPVPSVLFPHSRQEAHVSTPPLLSAGVSDTQQGEQEVEVLLAINGTTYEDAASILSNIRRRHGL